MNRRHFLATTVGLITSHALLDTLVSRALLAAPVRIEVERWARELDTLCRDLGRPDVDLVAWQLAVEDLLGRVDLEDLYTFIDYDRLTRDFPFPDLGTHTVPVPFPALGGLPERWSFHKKIFGLKKGRAILPHGHKNMVSAHLVLHGEMALRHYDKIEEDERTMLIEPTVDRVARAGDASSISDDRNNVHWFRTLTDHAFTLDVIVTGVDPAHPEPYEIDNIDPYAAELLPGGRLRAPKLTVAEALEKYGKEGTHH